jgi:hypothetical protein
MRVREKREGLRANPPTEGQLVYCWPVLFEIITVGWGAIRQSSPSSKCETSPMVSPNVFLNLAVRPTNLSNSLILTRLDRMPWRSLE